jgi:hypothetical protein
MTYFLMITVYVGIDPVLETLLGPLVGARQGTTVMNSGAFPIPKPILDDFDTNIHQAILRETSCEKILLAVFMISIQKTHTDL